MGARKYVNWCVKAKIVTGMDALGGRWIFVPQAAIKQQGNPEKTDPLESYFKNFQKYCPKN
jgi:hypothetical protein